MKWETSRDTSDRSSPYEEGLMHDIEGYHDSQLIIVCPEGGEPFEATPKQLRRLRESGALREYGRISFISDKPTVFWNELESRKKRLRDWALRQVDGLSDDQVIWYEETNHRGSFDSTTVKAWKEWYSNLDHERIESDILAGGRRVVSSNPHFNPDIRFQERDMAAEGQPPRMSRELLARARDLERRLEEMLEAFQARPDFLHVRDLLVVTFPGESARRMNYDDLASVLLSMTVSDLIKRGVPQVRILGLAKPLLEAVTFSST